jgi:predicted NAD/FAD-binding protein
MPFLIGHVRHDFSTISRHRKLTWMNDLQRLPSQKHGNLFATLNPLFPPSPTSILGHYGYLHPVLSAGAVRAQRYLAQPNAPVAWRHRAFAGAWTRYGFHKDGFASCMHTAAAVSGVVPPFPNADADVESGEPREGAMARLFDALEVVRAFAALFVGRVVLAVATATGDRRWFKGGYG